MNLAQVIELKRWGVESAVLTKESFEDLKAEAFVTFDKTNHLEFVLTSPIVGEPEEIKVYGIFITHD